MHQTCSKVLKIIIASFIIITCTACNDEKVYTKGMWLEDIMDECGMTHEDDIVEDSEKWRLVYEDIKINEALDFGFVVNSIGYYLSKDKTYDKQLKTLNDLNIITSNKTKNELINQKMAKEYIESFKTYINNQHFKEEVDFTYRKPFKEVVDYKRKESDYLLYENFKVGDYLLIDDQYYEVIENNQSLYKLKELSYDDVFEKLYISGGDNFDFSKAEIIEEFAFSEIDSIYEDDGRKSKDFKTRVTNLYGYRVSYELGLNKIRIYVSKKLNNGANVFMQTDLHGINPQYKWNYDKGKLEDTYLKLSFNTSEHFGISSGKNKQYFGDLSSIEKENLFNSLKNFVKPKSEMAETSFKLFTIKTPIPNVPFADITMSIYLNFSINGKVEVNVETSHDVGFEVKDHNLRFISDHDMDSNLKASASAISSLNLDFGLNAVNIELADILFKGGIKAKVEPILHLFVDNELKSQKLNTEYDVAYDMVEKQDDFKLCGDVSLNWIFEINLNSDNTIASRFGFKKTKSILNENDQIFGNMSHIENGMFVEKCTVKAKDTLTKPEIIAKPDNIILDKMSLVLKKKTIDVPIVKLPASIKMEDIRYEVKDKDILEVSNHQIIAIKAGSTSIRIYDKDQKYEVFLNVLVSNEIFKTVNQ